MPNTLDVDGTGTTLNVDAVPNALEVDNVNGFVAAESLGLTMTTTLFHQNLHQQPQVIVVT